MASGVNGEHDELVASAMDDRFRAMTLSRRLGWLAGCLALGLALGLTGFHFTADSAWFVAIPAVLAVGWFVIADPTRCSPAPRRGGGEHRLSEEP